MQLAREVLRLSLYAADLPWKDHGDISVEPRTRSVISLMTACLWGKEEQKVVDEGGCLHCLRCCVKGNFFPLFFYPPVCLFLRVCLLLLLHPSFYSHTFAAVGTNLAKMEPLPHFFLN